MSLIGIRFFQWLGLHTTVNRSTGCNPFEIVAGFLPKKPIDLVPLPMEAQPSVEADALVSIYMIYMMRFEGRLLLAMRITRHILI